jgi:hypothetical protein
MTFQEPIDYPTNIRLCLGLVNKFLPKIPEITLFCDISIFLLTKTAPTPLSGHKQEHDDTDGVNQTDIGKVGGGEVIEILLAALVA